LTALRGDYHGWGKFITHGHVPGDSAGNFAVAAHIVSAVVLMFGGALQFVPRIRNRFPVFHRWNGRIYLLATLSLSVAGLYMLWFRGSVGDGWQRAGSSLNAVAIWICATMALRRALDRDFMAHRRWALRLFLVASAAYFFRVAFFLTLLIFQRPVGFDPATFSGPLPTFLSFAQFAVPLLVLETHLRAQDAGGAIQRLAVAGLLFVLASGMIGGILAITMAVWIPDVKAGFACNGGAALNSFRSGALHRVHGFAGQLRLRHPAMGMQRRVVADLYDA
jgi:hypothetical protein